MLPVVGCISHVRTSLKLKQNTETTWNSFSVRTKQNCRRSAETKPRPSAVLFYFSFISPRAIGFKFRLFHVFQMNSHRVNLCVQQTAWQDYKLYAIQFGAALCWNKDRLMTREKNNWQRFVVAVVNHCSFLSFLFLLLKLKIFLKHRRKAVALQQAGFPDYFFVIGRQTLEVEQQRDAVACRQNDWFSRNCQWSTIGTRQRISCTGHVYFHNPN